MIFSLAFPFEPHPAENRAIAEHAIARSRETMCAFAALKGVCFFIILLFPIGFPCMLSFDSEFRNGETRSLCIIHHFSMSLCDFKANPASVLLKEKQ